MRPSGVPRGEKRFFPARLGWMVLFALIFGAPSAHAGAALTGTTTYTPADSGRTAMDIGGVWDGTAEVTTSAGDVFTLTLDNSSGSTAFDLTLTATLPGGFTYVDGTAVGIAGLTATQAGTTLTFNVPSDTDIVDGGQIDIAFGLTTDTTVVGGTFQLDYAVGFGTTDGAVDGSLSVPQDVVVKAGATVLNVDPISQTLAVNDTAMWTVTVTNTGLGGLFDVELDETLLNPNPNSSLQITAMTQTGPALVAAEGPDWVYTLPYLAPGESFVMDVEATVIGCELIDNTVQATDRTLATATSQTASVTLDLNDALIAIVPPAVQLDYAVPVNAVVAIDSTAKGDATNLAIQTNLHTLGVTLTNVDSDWAYNGSDGKFTYLANGGTLGMGATASIVFDVAPTDVCASPGGGLVIWTADYTNGCGDPFMTPTETSTMSPTSTVPSLTLNKSMADDRVEVGTPGQFQITIDAANTQFIATDPIVVTDVLPADITNVSITAPAGAPAFTCSGACEGGDTISWSVPLSALTAPLTLTIDFIAPVDPCLGGTLLSNTASLIASSTAGCALDTSASADILLINNPESGVSQNFNIVPAPDGTYETGVADDGDATLEVTEGEFVPVTTSYSFGAAYPGEWAGSTYVDGFGGIAGQTLVPTTLEVSIDGGAFQPVAAGDIVSSTGTLEIDLSFVGTQLGDVNVADHSFALRYSTTIPDAGLPLPEDQRTYAQVATLTVTNGGGDGSCAVGGTFTQGDFVTIARAVVAIQVDMPAQISVCEEFDVDITVSNATPELSSNVIVTLFNDANYEFIGLQATPYSGVFNATDVNFDGSGLNPTFQYLPDELPGTGVIHARVRRKAGSGTGNAPLSAQVDYDDNETFDSVTFPTQPTRDFTATNNGAPALVRTANLLLTVTPQTLTILSDQAQWVIYVSNGGDGPAYGVTLQDILPDGLLPNEAATDALNTFDAVVDLPTRTFSWTLGDIAAGSTVEIKVVADVAGTLCSLGANDITAEWGCDTQIDVTSDDPALIFPDGQLQVLHDTANSMAVLCSETGTVTIVVRNTDAPHVYDTIVSEVLGTAAPLAVDYVANSTVYSIDGVNFDPGGNPTGTGVVGDPYQWGPAQICELSDLSPLAENGTIDLTDSCNTTRRSTVWIRFNVSANEGAHPSDPSIFASANGDTACSADVDSPGTPFVLPVERPDITVLVTGLNITDGETVYSETVVAGPGDDVQWRVEIQNNGDATAENVRLEDTLVATGNTTGTLIGPGHAGGTTITSGVPVTIPDIPSQTAVVYTVDEMLGATCMDGQNVAEVTWGCESNGANAHSNLSTPTDNRDGAELKMIPDFGGNGITQAVTPLPGGRAEVAITMANWGGTAANLVLTSDLPGDVIYDDSFAATVTSTGLVIGMIEDSSDLTAPVFTLIGSLDDGTAATVRFRVIPDVTDSSNFDSTSDPFINPETVGNSLDPSPPNTASNDIHIEYETTCGAIVNANKSVNINLRTPDIDISVTPLSTTVAAGQTLTFTFTLTNVGDASSVANMIDFASTLGSGWDNVVVTAVTAGDNGAGGVCPGGDCDDTIIGTLDQNQSAVITIQARANDNGQPLTLEGVVTGHQHDDAGNDEAVDYSLDAAGVKAIGFSMSKTLLSSSEASTIDPLTIVGEESTWQLDARWFGGDTITGVTVRDSLPEGLGFVSTTPATGNDLTPTITSPAPVSTGEVDYTITTINGEGTFRYELVARTLNVAGNVSATPLINAFDAQFDALGVTFESSEFGGTDAPLHVQAVLAVVESNLTFDKQVLNVTKGTSYADGTVGVADDVLEYRIVISNTGIGPAFDIAVDDLLDAKLNLISGTSDGVDNDGDGTVDDATEGTFVAGLGGSVTFDHADTQIASGTPSKTFGQLDAGQSITLLYRATVDVSANPNEQLPNDANFVASSLSGTSGSQTAPIGTPDDPDGERTYNGSDTENITTQTLTLGKSLIQTSVGSLDTDVLVGEQARFELIVVLPAGTVTNFKVVDILPANLGLIETPLVTIGSAISSPATQPTITPATLPANGSPLTVTWDFGTRTVSADPVEANRTVRITYLTQVRNDVLNIDGATFANDAMYMHDGSPTNMGAVTLSVIEPDLAVTFDVDLTGTVDAADTLTYTVTIPPNAGDGTAYDVNLVAALPAGLTYTVNSTDGSGLGEPDIAGQVLTWGREQSTPQDIDLATGIGLTYTFEVTVDDTVEPEQQLDVGLAVDWTSLDGTPGPDLGITMATPGTEYGERTGAGGANDYGATQNVARSVANAVAIAKTASGDTVPTGGGFSVGDLITYTVEFSFHEGTFDNVIVEDSLPGGVAFHDFTAITPAPGNSGFTYTAPIGGNAPAQDDTGMIQWTIGTLVNAGDADPGNDTLTLVYRARVLDGTDIPATPTSVSIANSALVRYEDSDENDETSIASVVSVDVKQPRLVLALDGPAMIDVDTPGDVAVRVENLGDSPAYQPVIEIFLPDGTRDIDPTTLAMSLDITGGRSLALVRDTDYTASFTMNTGVLVFMLTSSQAYIDVTETLTASIKVGVDTDLVDQTGLTLLSTATDYASQDVSGGIGSETRSYPTIFGNGTTGTSNAAQGDDPTDDHMFIGDVPALAVTKSVDQTTAAPGNTLHYQISVTNEGNSDADDVVINDEIGAGFEPGTLRNVVSTPAGGTLVVNPMGGAEGAGQFSLSGLTIAPGSSVVVDFDIDVAAALPDGFAIGNQASVTLGGFGSAFVSDSTNSADDNGVEEGNDAADADDDDPVLTTIGSAPLLAVTKDDADINGGPLEPGETVRYTIVATNSGNEDVVMAVLQDSIPANTSYIAGTTMLNGAPVADTDGTTPVLNGMSISSPGTSGGRIRANASATVTFDVQVSEDVAAGSVIFNQAILSGQGEGSGAFESVLSDDPSTAPIADPTRSAIGNAAVLDATKIAIDNDGGTATVGDTLTYVITIANGGTVVAAATTFSDAIPADTTYVPGSISIDPDGNGPSSPIDQSDVSDGDSGDFDQSVPGSVFAVLGDIGPGAQAVVRFDVTIDGVADGTVLVNQGVVNAAGRPAELTDFDGNDANGDQPTPTVVGNAPALRMLKQIIDINGGVVRPGDTLEYVIDISNAGVIDATNLIVTDPVPPDPTSYVAGSTRVNGIAVADSGPSSALVGGLHMGTLPAGESTAVRFRVRIPASATNGAAIVNQASFTADGGLAGVSDSSLNDGTESGNDPNDANDDDPTLVEIGVSPTLANVSGIVWLDIDHDRVLGPHEAPLVGWIVEILLGDQVLQSTISDGDGRYTFAGLMPGSGYEIRFRHPATNTVYGGAVSSAPGVDTSRGTIANLTLVPGTTVLEQNLPLDPSGVIYNVVTRELVEGAVVTLLGPPGYEPNVHLLPGQQVQLTGDDGYYRFDLIGNFPQNGLYIINVVPPTGYLPQVPSSIIAPEPSPLDPTGLPDPLRVQEQEGAPQGNQPTTYYLEFLLAGGDPNVVNNHIPIDPILEGALVVRKTTSRTNVSRGDLVPYTISVTNTTEATLTSIDLYDLLPPGFKYVDGSGTLDGTEADIDRNGRTVVWRDLTFGPGDERTMTLVTIIGSGVGEGNFINRAWALNSQADAMVSNVGEATVRIVPDPTFDVAELIGRVFLDRNANGYQDDDEPGIPHVRLATATGLVVTTDAYGRYHIAAAAIPNEARGSQFIVKLDPRSLPTGYRLTTENPRVVRMTRGKMTKANFGVFISRVVRFDLSGAIFIDETSSSQESVAPVFKQLVAHLAGSPSALRLTYFQDDGEPDARARERVDAIAKHIRTLWGQGDDRYTLIIECEVVESTAGARVDEPIGVLRTPAGSSSGAWERAEHGQVVDNARTRIVMPPVNTEQSIPDTATRLPYAVDGEYPGPDSQPPAAIDLERQADVALHAHGLALRYDPRECTPRLNVTAVPAVPHRDEPVMFTMETNYRSWISRAEVRLYPAGESVAGVPLHVLPLNEGHTVVWDDDARELNEYRYVLRVYDDQGRFDETAPKRLVVRDGVKQSDTGAASNDAAPAGYGENHRFIGNIPVTGGAVLVNAGQVQPGSRLRVMGRDIPIDTAGTAAAEQILPPGAHGVAIEMLDGDGQTTQFQRDIYIPDDDWFYVALADLTLGGNSSNGPAALVTHDDQLDDNAYFNGRLAFYVKGKMKGDWLLTASGDTREGDLDDMFSNFNEKDPRQLLRRLDADRFYPVYGDDSTLIEDAPTNGKLYVRLERGDSHVMWGNFYTSIVDTDLAQIDRALYGGHARLVSPNSTAYGERKATVEIFAAQPETLDAREEHRGTGGSLYFLRHQDILNGSERVRIEVRDQDSGLVLNVQNLIPYEDYDIDPIQGRILLTRPLASVAEDGLLVNNGTLPGHPAYLVVRYEYRPSLADLEDTTAGGRASRWINDHVEVGVTAHHQEQTGIEQDLIAGDVTVRMTPQTYIKAEVAHTDGIGQAEFESVDGGFDFFAIDRVADPSVSAAAWRLEGALKLSDLFGERHPGRIAGYYEQRDRGFSAPGRLTPRDLERWGLDAHFFPGERIELRAKYDETRESGRASTRTLNVDATIDLTEHWYTALGMRMEDIDDTTAGGIAFARRSGERTDAQLRLGYRSEKDWEAYGFMQGTLHRDGERHGNDRFGVGGTFRLTERLTVGGEVSEGDGGLGALVSSDYAVNDRTNLYVNIESSTDRTDVGHRGRATSVVSGARTRFADNASVYIEQRRLDSEYAPSGLTHAFGFDLAPDERWTVGLSFENGRLYHAQTGEIDRTAVAVSAAYDTGSAHATSSIEWRKDLAPAGNRETWLFRNHFGYQVNPDWRMLGKLNIAFSDSENGDFFNGDFIEGVVGAAYRPVTNDRLNTLFKYTYFEDLPAPGQLSRRNDRFLYEQRSHVLSVDATVDLTPRLALGGKYGLRIGELRNGRDGGNWFSSTAHLGIVRFDWHAIREWDIVAEGRLLSVEEAHDRRAGMLLGVYRHFGDHLKLGAGYNFTDFSDDLTDRSYDHQGWFINLVGKF